VSDNKTMSKATPWHVETAKYNSNHFIVTDHFGEPLVSTATSVQFKETAKANAELIVKAVNMHDELVEFIENLENDDGSIPAKIWEWRNSILQKAKAAK
jgi:hypothetical protein